MRSHLTQVLILLRMPPPPPTFRSVVSAKTSDARRDLLQAVLLLRVQSGTVDVEVPNEALRVEIDRSFLLICSVPEAL